MEGPDNVMQREQFIALISALTFVGVLVVIALVVWLIRRHHRAESEIKHAGGRVDALAENNDLDHREINRKIDKQTGRLQFLVAKDIAVQLAEEKARKLMEEGGAPPKDDTQ